MKFKQTSLKSAMVKALDGFSGVAIKSAAVFALGAVATTASALTASQNFTTKAKVYAPETVTASSILNATIAADSNMTLTNASSALVSGMYVKLTLSSGVFADGNSTLAARVTKGDCTNAVDVTLDTSHGGGSGTNFALFKINGGVSTCPAGKYFTIKAGGFQIKGPTALAATAGKLEMLVETFLSDPMGALPLGIVDAAFTYPIVDTAGTASTATNAAAGAAAIADIDAGAMKFVGGGDEAIFGTLQFTPSTDLAMDTGAAFALDATNDYATVTLTGDFSNPAMLSGAVDPNAVYYDVDDSKTYTSGDVSCPISGGAVATCKIPLTKLAMAYAIRYKVSGSSVIMPSSYNASIAYTYGKSSYKAPTTQSIANFGQVSTNGVVASIPFLNNYVDASSGYVSVVQVNNLDCSREADVLVRLYPADGTTTSGLATGKDGKLGKVPKCGSKLFFVNDFETATGLQIPTTKKGRATIMVNSFKANVVGFMMNPGGTLSNMSSRVDQAGTAQ